MVLTPNVVAGATIQSAWGNTIRDRTLQVFTDATERDAQWTNPPEGAHCLTLSTLAVWVRASGVWVPLAADGRPIGLLTLATTGSATTTAPVPIGSPFSFTLAASRCVGIQMSTLQQRGDATGQVRAEVAIDGVGTRCARISHHDTLGGPGQSLDGALGYKDLAAGLHQAQFRILSPTANPTAQVVAGSWFTITDAGPNLGLFP